MQYHRNDDRYSEINEFDEQELRCLNRSQENSTYIIFVEEFQKQ